MDIVLRESDRLNETIRSFLAYARPQRSARRDSMCGRSSPTPRGCSRTTPRSTTATIVVTCPPTPVVIPRRRSADPPDRLEPRDQRLARDAERRRAAAARSRRIKRGRRRGDVVIAVQDEGVGIAPEEIDGIFQPFRGGSQAAPGWGCRSSIASPATTAAKSR